MMMMPIAFVYSVFTNSVSLALTIKNEKPRQFFYCLWKLLYHFTIKESAKSRGSHVCILPWVCAPMGQGILVDRIVFLVDQAFDPYSFADSYSSKTCYIQAWSKK